MVKCLPVNNIPSEHVILPMTRADACLFIIGFPGFLISDFWFVISDFWANAIQQILPYITGEIQFFAFGSGDLPATTRSVKNWISPVIYGKIWCMALAQIINHKHFTNFMWILEIR